MRLKLISVIIILLGGINVTSGDYPDDMEYSYDWFSFWCGQSKLNVEFNDGDLIANYEISINEENPGICCLLYTSPSPRDATLSRMPSSA